VPLQQWDLPLICCWVHKKCEANRFLKTFSVRG